ncbi:phosphotransferase [Cryobacterium sp. TMS1-13-1]|uniref:phosphotransferase n=1 Tax=Cryobacterium sp. TMS1-13-1 TaxID=1259220 RepID=UPI001069360A|nr:phosphotransferase [Cryobacterium sp. TMS1-13-1]TFD21211.1 aminoglycoside phosphotransferase family protein [Cryobacterium sp. TMS1-13-1]
MTAAAPSPLVLEWAARQLAVAELRWVRSLPGGTHARTSVVGTPDGAEFVLRQFPPGDDAVRLEIRVLSTLGDLGELAPQLLAADADGTVNGCPVIVTTLLPGRASITPTNPHDFARQLGAALARIHSLAVNPGLTDLFTEPATESPMHSVWHQLTGEPRVLTHNDFWSGNTVWLNERLTGIVDWSGAGRAPRGYDLAWCRQDLVFLYDVTVADGFTRAYDQAFGSPTPDVALWDHFAAMKAYPRVETWAPNYTDLGRDDLDGAGLRRRLTEWMLRLDAG